MGILSRFGTKDRLSLAALSVVGRSPPPQCIIVLADPRVSKLHAMLSWTGEQWEIRDLGSSNGTFVDGKRLVGNERVPLREGSELRFASGDPWVLVSALPPVACATSESGKVCVAESGLLVLPEIAAPVACVYEDADGLWHVEVGEEARVAVDQETIIAGEPWVLSIPPPMIPASVATTVRIGRALLLELVTLSFRHSSNEEYVEMAIVHEDGATSYHARACYYMLLILARARLRDREAGKHAVEQGWIAVEELLTMLHTDAERLNMDIFRARRELAKLGVMDAGAIIERRSGIRQVRIGAERIEITRI